MTLRATAAEASDPIMVDVASVSSDREQPTQAARAIARELAEGLRSAGVSIGRVLADPDGGIALYAFADTVLEGGAHARYARVSSTNAGEALALVFDRVTDEERIWDIATVGRLESFDRIRAFIRGA